MSVSQSLGKGFVNPRSLGSRPASFVPAAAIAIGAIVLGAVLGLSQRASAPIVVIAVGLVLLSVTCALLFRASEQRDRVWRWTLLSLVLHLAIGGSILFVDFLAGYFLGDGGGYHRDAVALVENWFRSGPPVHLTPGKEGYAIVLGGLYTLVGPIQEAGVALNCVAGAALVPVVTATSQRLFGTRASRSVPMLVTLFPGFLIWPAQLLKEAVILFLIALIMYSTARLGDRFGFGSIATLGLSMAALLTFRAPVAAGLVIGFIVSAMFRQRRVKTMSTLMTAGGVLGVVLMIGIGAPGFQAVLESDLEQASHTRSATSVSAGSAFKTEADISSAGKWIANVPGAVARFVFGPFPWEIRRLDQSPALLEGIVWLALLVPFWRGVRYLRATKNRKASPLLLGAITITLILAPVIGNYGLLLRERSQVVLLLIPVIALGVGRAPGRSQSLR